MTMIQGAIGAIAWLPGRKARGSGVRPGGGGAGSIRAGAGGIGAGIKVMDVVQIELMAIARARANAGLMHRRWRLRQDGLNWRWAVRVVRRRCMGAAMVGMTAVDDGCDVRAV